MHDIAGEFDVVVGEFSVFGIVDTHNLVLLGASQVETGDEVDDEEDEAGPAE